MNALDRAEQEIENAFNDGEITRAERDRQLADLQDRYEAHLRVLADERNDR